MGARSLRGRMLVTWDSCYIHRGCVGGASYSFGTDKDGRPDSMGAGWYCNDGQYVDGSTQYDQCQIHTNCQGVYYDESTQVWRCNDHADRNLGSSYSAPGSGSIQSSADSRQLRSEAHYEHEEAREALKANEHAAKADYAATMAASKAGVFSVLSGVGGMGVGGMDVGVMGVGGMSVGGMGVGGMGGMGVGVGVGGMSVDGMGVDGMGVGGMGVGGMV